MAARKPQHHPLRRTCATMPAHMMLLETDPGFRSRQARLEQRTARRRAAPIDLSDLPLVTIPVVVHVVHHTRDQNLSDAQIESQIAVLNRDFRAANPDRERVPGPWKGLVTDARIDYCLARVTRTRTARAAFPADDSVKHPASGGVAAHQPGRCLNLWVCPLAAGLLGYAQFPGGPSRTDGVVINYRTFGTLGTAEAPFNRGRTATHEIGHYLNLRHIWGDTEDCSGGDRVADTPNAAGPNYGRPRFPSISCDNGPHGDMFMNFMDYTDDAAMHLFTAQQVARMRAALEGPRRGLGRNGRSR